MRAKANRNTERGRDKAREEGRTHSIQTEAAADQGHEG